MDHETYGDGDDDLVFVMGLGNRLGGENEEWFLDHLTEAGYRVHAFELGDDLTRFEEDFLRPVREYCRDADLDDPVMLGHSVGGLVVAHVQPDRGVYLSPYWGPYGGDLSGPAFDLVGRLGFGRKMIPNPIDREELGTHVTDDRWAAMPDRLSPAWVREVRRAQRALPAVVDARVFCSLRDTVVDHPAIGRRVPSNLVSLYDGGHEVFSSGSRETVTERVVSAIRAEAEHESPDPPAEPTP